VRIGLLPLLLVRVAIVFIIRDPAGILRRQRQVQFLVILVIDSFGSVIGHDQRYQDASSKTSSGLLACMVCPEPLIRWVFQWFLLSDWSSFEQSA